MSIGSIILRTYLLAYRVKERRDNGPIEESYLPEHQEVLLFQKSDVRFPQGCVSIGEPAG
jgi:hypothetical protein